MGNGPQRTDHREPILETFRNALSRKQCLQPDSSHLSIAVEVSTNAGTIRPEPGACSTIAREGHVDRILRHGKVSRRRKCVWPNLVPNRSRNRTGFHNFCMLQVARMILLGVGGWKSSSDTIQTSDALQQIALLRLSRGRPIRSTWKISSLQVRSYDLRESHRRGRLL